MSNSKVKITTTGDFLQTYENDLGAGPVHSEAVTPTDPSGSPYSQINPQFVAISKGARTTREGASSSSSRFIDVRANFHESVASSQVVKVSGNDPTQTGSKAIFNGGSWRSLDNCRYREGRTTELTNSAAFTGTPGVGEYALIGVGNADGTSGFFYGSLDGEDVFIFRRSGVNEIVRTRSTGEWDDPLDGTGVFQAAYDRSKANVWSLSFIWHGNGNAILDIAGTGRDSYLPAATLELINTRDDASLEDPDVYVWIESSANMAVATSSWALGSYLGARDNQVNQSNSYSGTLASSATFTGEWMDLATFLQFNTVVESDQTLEIHHEYSADGTNVLSGVVPVFFHSGDGTSRRFQLGVYARYARVRLVSTSISTANITIQTLLLPGESRLSTHRIGDQLSSDRSAEVVKSVIAAQQPDGDWTNARSPGIATDVDGNPIETTSALGAAGTYESGWMDTDGFAELEVTIATDQVSATNGVVIEYTDDTGLVTPVVRTRVERTFDAVDVSEGSLVFRVGTVADGFRIRYTNGGTPQGSFYLGVVAKPIQSTQSTVSLAGELSNTDQALISRGPVDASDDSGVWGKIGRYFDALRSSIKFFETDAPIRPGDGWAVTRGTATITPSQTPSSSLADRISIEIHNSDNNRILWIGVSSAAIGAGQYRALSSGESIVLELGPTVPIWIRSDSSTCAYEIIEISDGSLP